jgi:hypothetical protein
VARTIRTPAAGRPLATRTCPPRRTMLRVVVHQAEAATILHPPRRATTPPRPRRPLRVPAPLPAADTTSSLSRARLPRRRARAAATPCRHQVAPDRRTMATRRPRRRAGRTQRVKLNQEATTCNIETRGRGMRREGRTSRPRRQPCHTIHKVVAVASVVRVDTPHLLPVPLRPPRRNRIAPRRPIRRIHRTRIRPSPRRHRTTRTIRRHRVVARARIRVAAAMSTRRQSITRTPIRPTTRATRHHRMWPTRINHQIRTPVHDRLRSRSTPTTRNRVRRAVRTNTSSEHR